MPPAAPDAAGAATDAAPAADLRLPLPAGAPLKNMRVVYLGKEYEEPLPLSYAEKPIYR